MSMYACTLWLSEGFLILGDSSTHGIHLFWRNVCHSILKQYWSFWYTKVFIPKYFIVFPAVFCWLKALGICAEGSWVRVDFLYGVRLWESLINLYSELKARALSPLKGNNKKQKRLHITIPQISQISCIFNEYQIQYFDWEVKI